MRMLSKAMKMNRDELNKYNNIIVLPHKNPDGDALGSAVAVSLMMKKLGKSSRIVIDDEISPELEYLLDYEDFLSLEDVGSLVDNIDLAIVVDSGSLDRLERRLALISEKPVWNIDHHITNPRYGDYNRVEPSYASTCEIVYEFFKEFSFDMDKEIAEALYTGVSTDTGNFMYSNTTERTFQIAADLLSYGIDRDSIVRHLYQSKRREKVELFSSVMLDINYEYGGKLAYAVVDEELLNRHSCTYEDTEGLVENIRNVDGVEFAVIFKESYNSKVSSIQTKVSMRSIGTVDVSGIAEYFGGGGHKSAAGFDIKEPKELVLERFFNYVREHVNF